MGTASKTAGTGARKRRRRSAEETRQILLRAGTDLVLASLHADNARDGGPVAHIRVQDVVRKASEHEDSAVTTGALYNIWPSQQSFQVDLMFHILEAGAYPSAEPILELAAELFAQRLPVYEIGERLSDEGFEIERESPMTRAARAFAALTGAPAVREALSSAHGIFLESGRKLYSQLLTYSGLRVRSPYTLDQLITVIGAMNDGLQAVHEIAPELFELPKGTRSIVATAAAGVFREFCEPIDKPGTEPAEPPDGGGQ